MQIKTSFKSDLWRALVDPTQIELAVLNLAINARDASEVGDSITLETANATVGPPENAHEPSAGEYVVVSVTDNGTGMHTPPLVYSHGDTRSALVGGGPRACTRCNCK